jgi:hypothetical protein
MSVTKRLLLTIAFLTLFRIVAVLPLPGVDRSYMESIGRGDRINVMSLGLQPFVASFTIVELWSLVFERGLRLRRGGTAGRKVLNRFALPVGILIAVMQAGGIALALQRLGPPDVPRIVANPGLYFTLTIVATLVGGTALAFLLASAVSHWGVGSGFSWLIVLPGVASATVRSSQIVTSSGQLFSSGLEPLVWIAAVGLLVKMFVQRPQAALSEGPLEGVPVSLPAFPQGIAPVVWTYSLFNFYATTSLVFRQDSSSSAGQFQSPVAIFVMAVMMAALCPGAFYLFSSRKRLEWNLPSKALPHDELPVGRWLLPTSVVLVVFGTVFETGRSFFGLPFIDILGFNGLVLLVAMVLDLIAEVRFRIKHRDSVASVIEMDNVYGACYLQGLLARNGIDSVTRAFHYRSLLFFLGPVFKMEVLVPAAERIRAQEIIQTADLKVV